MLVQDVIAAINIEPSLIVKSVLATFETDFSFLFVASFNTFLKELGASVKSTLS